MISPETFDEIKNELDQTLQTSEDLERQVEHKMDDLAALQARFSAISSDIGQFAGHCEMLESALIDLEDAREEAKDYEIEL